MWQIAVPLATAALGAYMGNEQQKAQAKARKDQALINMYAPLFGNAPTALGAEKDMVTPGLIQGGMSGYQMAAQIDMQNKLNRLLDPKLADTSSPLSSTPMAVLFPQEAQRQYQNYYQPTAMA